MNKKKKIKTYQSKYYYKITKNKRKVDSVLRMKERISEYQKEIKKIKKSLNKSNFSKYYEDVNKMNKIIFKMEGLKNKMYLKKELIKNLKTS